MKKLIYLFAVTATLSLAVSCKSGKKEKNKGGGDNDTTEDMTMQLPTYTTGEMLIIS